MDLYDYVIVGGGSAGCVLAGRLTAGGASVLLLEAGGTDRRPDVVVPAGIASVYKLCNWNLAPEPDPTRNGVVEPWPAGRILGGSGSINGTVFVRGHPSDFDGWAEAGCTGWDFSSVLPYFRRLETWEGGADQYRGGDGPIAVGYHTMSHPACTAFEAAAAEAGHGPVADCNAASPEGVSRIQVNQRRGRRSSSSEFLRRVAERSRLTVRTGALARRVVFTNGRANGVEYRHRRQDRRAEARRGVIISAGALASPKLLMVSGLGPADDLRRLGIPVVADLPEVGANLSDHIGVVQRWNARVRTLNELRPSDAIASVWEYLRHGTGNLAAVVFQVQVILRTQQELPIPDVQLAFASFAIDRRGPDGELKVRPAKHRSVMVTTALVHPQVTGRLRLRSADPFAPPRIEHAMLSCREDVQAVLAGMAEARRIMNQPAMAPIIAEPFAPERACVTEEDWTGFLRDQATYGVHSTGTCRMGVDDGAVVDPELRVRGVAGLRVVDASVFPTNITGNTNASVMMVAEKAADLLQSD